MPAVVRYTKTIPLYVKIKSLNNRINFIKLLDDPFVNKI